MADYGLAMPNIHKEISIDINEAVNRFPKQNQWRMMVE